MQASCAETNTNSVVALTLRSQMAAVETTTLLHICRYYLSEPEQTPHMPVCMGGHSCNFNMTQRLACPFWAAGTYRSEEREVSIQLQVDPHAAEWKLLATTACGIPC